MFDKVTKKLISDQVFDLLKESITSGDMIPGDKLPSEIELAKKFGVSRPSVKAAVDKLKAFGLIESRAGDGTYVKKYSLAEYLRNFPDWALKEDNVGQLLELRRAIDSASLMLAIQHANEEDIRLLSDLCSHLTESARKGDYEETSRFDYAFHLQICKTSRNRYFLMIYEMIENVIKEQIRIFSHNYLRANVGRSYVDDHAILLEAIRQKDYEKGENALRAMLDRRNLTKV